MSFFSEYFGITDSFAEQQVLCPFPHSTENGVVYYETNPSAHVNTEKGVFHCKSCGAGYSELQFLEQVLGCSTTNAVRILKAFEHAENQAAWAQTKHLSAEGLELGKQLGISEETLAALQVATPTGIEDALQFPVFLYGQLMDIRTYRPGGTPKLRSRTNSIMGLILPYDLWQASSKNRVTLICAGEKDMAVARSHGFNAITLTGGERIKPKLFAEFAERKVAICYDNDEAGKQGSKQLALALSPHAASVKVVTGFHEICTGSGEDLTDFFVKYNRTREDLINYIENTPEYIPTAEDLQSQFPIVDLITAAHPKNINKMLQSNIQVVAVTDTTFTVPTAVVMEKFKLSRDNDLLNLGDCKTWELNENTLGDLLHLMDNNFKEEAIEQNLRNIMRVPKKEKYIKKRILNKGTVFKAHITDLFETNTESAVPMEFVAYCLNTRLESGQKYTVDYKLVPHPYKGQQLTMLITEARQANDSVSNFQITEDKKRLLRNFQQLEGTVAERINQMTERVKGLLGYDGNNILIQAIDLAYHTVLQFHFGSFKDERGYLDLLVVGESRVGKSSTANALRQAYGLGVFTSLAGNSATIPGLIGGSNKTNNGFQTRAGVIPQNHRGLVIFEEFGKCKQDIISELTDIRSSNEVRIARVSGTVTLPALVRMISLTNVKNTGGTPKPIAMYPNGVSIITELVGTAEDIARYDLLVVLPDRGTSQIDPFWEPSTPFTEEEYRTRIRWVWSRTADHIQISREVGLYIMERANALNTEFDSHIKIFGTEAWKKLTRLSIAVAGYLVSTDPEFENILVLKEHVDFAEHYFRTIYDNSTFKLREYVVNERLYSNIDEDGISALQDLFTKYPALLLQLEKSAICSKNMLASASGLSSDELNKALSRLTKALFIRYQNYDIVPTERFRIGMSEIDRATHVSRVGE